MLNLIFSFIWAFCCFFELMASATPVTVGIAVMRRSPMTIVIFFRCRLSLVSFVLFELSPLGLS